MLPEVCLLRYAFACARNKVDVQKKITEDDYKRLKQAVDTDTPLPREYLASIFVDAIAGLKSMTPDFWHVDIIREYYWNRHPEYVAQNVHPILHELCLVKKATLEAQLEKAFRARFENGKSRTVIPLYKGARVGDTVMVHYAYAAEKVD
jgi:hypothetical protein